MVADVEKCVGHQSLITDAFGFVEQIVVITRIDATEHIKTRAASAEHEVGL